MTDKEATLARSCYCIGRSCDDCLFNTYAKNKFNTDCGGLTADQIRYILSIIKEEESMTKKEEIQQEIEKTQKQLAALQEKLKEAEDEVPGVLPFDIGDELFVVNIDGKVIEFRFTDSKEWDYPMREVHRAFKSKNYAKAFAEKTQIIADMLHFKWLYDRNHEPNWDSEDEGTYCIYYDIYTKHFTAYCSAALVRTESVYFSTRELAERCAKWLNKKYGHTKE